MIRTQIYLTEELKRRIHLAAATERKPEAQVIREALHVGLARLSESLGLVSDAPHLWANIGRHLYDL